jgi:hypothetical protein
VKQAYLGLNALAGGVDILAHTAPRNRNRKSRTIIYGRSQCGSEEGGSNEEAPGGRQEGFEDSEIESGRQKGGNDEKAESGRKKGSGDSEAEKGTKGVCAINSASGGTSDTAADW